MKGAMFGFGAAMLMAAVAAPAAAQTTGASAAAPMGGPSPSGRPLTASLDFTAEHDTNLARTSPTLAAQLGTRPDDTVYNPSVTVGYFKALGRNSVSFSANYGYVFHENNKRLDTNHVNVDAGLSVKAGPCAVLANGAYARGRNELDDPKSRLATNAATAETATPPPSTRTDLVSTVFNIQETEEAGLVLSCARPTGIGAVAQASETWTSNSQTFSGAGRFRTFSGSLGALYQRPQFGTLEAVGFYSHTDNEDLTSLLLSAKGFESYGANLSYSRRLGGRIQASATVGYTHAHPISPPAASALIEPAKDFEGVTYEAAMRFRVTGRMQLRASVQRAVAPTLLSGSSYEVDTSYDAGVEYNMGQHITLSLTGEHQESNTNAALLIPTALALTNSRVNSVSASAGYKFNRRLSASLSGTHEDRTADNALFNYTNDRIALTLSSSF